MVESVKVENLSDCKVAADETLEAMMKQINEQKDNEAKVAIIELLKQPYLFTSSQLLQLLQCTPSMKTKIRIIASVGSRLTDPKARVGDFLDIFRYADEKQQVESQQTNDSISC